MIHLTSKNIQIDRPTAVAIGKFDGVHRGHMALLTELKRVANMRGLATIVLTFTPHPVAFFKKTHMPLLLDPREKLELFESIGFDYFLEYTFDEEFAQTPPEVFLQEVVSKKLQAQSLVVAEGYRFGKGGAGTVELARRVCSGLGIDVYEIGHVVHDGHKISSEFLRKLVGERDFSLLSALNGRDFFVTGHGKFSGLSTVSLAPHPDKLLPPNGVYATTTTVDGKIYNSVTNIGFNSAVETVIADFDADFSDAEIVIAFHSWLRDEL